MQLSLDVFFASGQVLSTAVVCGCWKFNCLFLASPGIYVQLIQAHTLELCNIGLSQNQSCIATEWPFPRNK